MIKLRGHHIFCLLGYRGMGYSAEYTENMTKIHDVLRERPDTLIQIIKGPDYLCAKFPQGQPYHCQDDGIYERDAVILHKLGLKVSDVLPWREVERRIRLHVVPEDIVVVCETCSWRSYGFCQEGVDDVLESRGLRQVLQEK
ncbi:hypothetical protein CSV78_06545 [Sporosarcina sp. P16a]|uniref:DUF1284 domain-containing protein n=1 Tax=unclassified Sporosarcina TaxID=2647733 RepID=UPI000C16CC3A|nr:MULTISPECIES: DUF1284 domain-containing protein [unclassified Sporosarcina]PIC67561.1 hypothetical protein CSV78_06545 [Sporosarcina sp. P16a]PIC93012.1 hypothetical protein CSV70_07295 [Sporosarcina sp. P25]